VPRSLTTAFLALALAAATFGFAAAEEGAPAPGVPAAAANAVPAAPPAAAVPAAAAPAAAADDATAAVPADAGPREGIPYVATGDPDAAAPPTTVVAPTAALPSTAAAPRSTAAAAAPAPHLSRLRRFASGIVSRSAAIASSLTRSAMRFIGTPYVFGGTRSSGFDCSGYVQHVFALLGFHLPRTADAQFDAAHHIVAPMAPGDLVFFHTYAPGVSHVGIYLGNSKFIHSSSSHGVSIASLHDSYWAPRYVGAKRVFGQ
jgi:cell wall-associated NlpC family hydrolase